MTEEHWWEAVGTLAGVHAFSVGEGGRRRSAFGTAGLPVWGQLNTA